jgi:hypothetical protein
VVDGATANSLAAGRRESGAAGPASRSKRRSRGCVGRTIMRQSNRSSAPRLQAPGAGGDCATTVPRSRETRPMAAPAADRHLLFGLLALQTGLIQQAQLVAAFHAWTCDKSRSLADHLVDRARFGCVLACKGAVDAGRIVTRPGEPPAIAHHSGTLNTVSPKSTRRKVQKLGSPKALTQGSTAIIDTRDHRSALLCVHVLSTAHPARRRWP